ncbi:MAG: hypothetical protein LQ352_006342 [Teloschistes flavicans]|nr:MAG: hypothetical protein LQ352_006342 [Teloschistes flavicans]
MTQYSRRSSVRSKRDANDGIPRRKRTLGIGSCKDRTSDEDGASQAPKPSRKQLSKKLRKKIARLREQVIISRLGLREQRVELREQHGTVRNLEAEFLRQVQLGDGSINPQTLRTLHNELCTALDELGPLEDDYDEKEDRLNTLEDDLQAQEDKFYRRHAHYDTYESNACSSSSRSSLSDESGEIDIDAAEEPDYSSPDYLYYKSQGEANMVRERLMELEGQRLHFLEIEQERNALGVPLYQENVEFLSNYSSLYGEQLEELRNIEKAMQGLEFQVERQDIEFQVEKQDIEFQPDFSARDSKSPSLTYSVGQHSDFGAGFQRGCPVTEPGQNGRLEIPSLDVPRRKSEADVWSIPADTRSNRVRINQWIFEKLEHSRLEKAHLRAWLEDPKLDRDKWWELVCHSWQFDRAARSSKDSSRHVSGHSTSAKQQELQGSPDTGLDEAFRAFHLTKITSNPAEPGDQPPMPTWSPNSDSIVRFDYLDLALNPSPASRKVERTLHSSLEC